MLYIMSWENVRLVMTTMQLTLTKYATSVIENKDYVLIAVKVRCTIKT